VRFGGEGIASKQRRIVAHAIVLRVQRGEVGEEAVEKFHEIDGHRGRETKMKKGKEIKKTRTRDRVDNFYHSMEGKDTIVPNLDYRMIIIMIARCLHVPFEKERGAMLFLLLDESDIYKWHEYVTHRRNVEDLPEVVMSYIPDMFVKSEFWPPEQRRSVVHMSLGAFTNKERTAYKSLAYCNVKPLEHGNYGTPWMWARITASRRLDAGCSTFMEELPSVSTAESTKSRELTVINPSESTVKQLCGWCGGLLKKNLWCSGCSSVAYCGAHCQYQHWPTHKSVCGKGKKK
jgi:hypothetical protein